MRVWFWVGILIGVQVMSCGLEEDQLGPSRFSSTHGISYKENIVFSSADGKLIYGNLFLPNDDGATKPAIILINSWSLDEHEYFVQAAKFAIDGYLVLSYSTRGFGASEGKVSAAGPKDISDLSAAIDWLLANTNADSKQIGVSGISYGAGISLLGLAHDARIKTVAAMSGWSDLEAAIYGADTPNLIWGTILVGSGILSGDLHPEVLKVYQNILSCEDIPWVKEWTKVRSPIYVVDKINERKAPVYLSNNFGDALFRPNGALQLFSKLSGPKQLDLNEGIHASAEISGLAGLPNYSWDNTHKWFDYWLKGLENGALDRPALKMEVRHENPTKRDSFSSWPSQKITNTFLYLGPPGWLSDGSLSDKPNTKSQTRKIISGDSGASSGIALISPILDSHLGLPVTKWIPKISRRKGIVFRSALLKTALEIRGIPELSVRVALSSKKAMLVAYLYDVNILGIGKLITYGPISVHDAKPNTPQTLSIALTATAYNIPAGHRIALVIDTHDVQFAPPTLDPYDVTFHFSPEEQSLLQLPQK